MSWNTYYAIYLDVDNPTTPLLDGTASAPRSQALRWVQADEFPLRIYFRRRAQIQTPSSSQQLPAGRALVLGGRQTVGNSVTGDLLIFADNFTEHQDGNEWYYETDLTLDTTELRDLFEADSKAITLQVDLELQDAGKPLTFVIPVTIIPQAYAGEGSPTPALGSVNVSRIIDGVLHLYNAEADRYYPLICTGPLGYATLSLGDPLDEA